MAHAFLFPGQGSQSVGMGAALADAFRVARDVFDEVDEALAANLSKLMREGPQDELTLTVNAQPALMAHSIAVARVLEKDGGAKIAAAQFVAGHSLGEYSALCASGAIGLSDCARLLRIRGEAMQSAVPPGQGAMAALIGVTVDEAEAGLSRLAPGGLIEIANDNAPGQVVVSGEKAAIEKLCAQAKTIGAKLAKILPVSAPFHSSLMAPAAERMAEALSEANLSRPRPGVIANVTAAPVEDVDQIRANLVAQTCGRVRWTESVLFMSENGVERFFELGTGKVLAGLVKRIAPDWEAMSAGDPESVEAMMRALS